MTWAPSAAKRSATARPMPELDPVTMARLCASRPTCPPRPGSPAPATVSQPGSAPSTGVPPSSPVGRDAHALGAQLLDRVAQLLGLVDGVGGVQEVPLARVEPQRDVHLAAGAE